MGSDGVRAPSAADVAMPRAVAIFGSYRYGQYYEDLLAGVCAAADVAGSSVIAVQNSVGVMPSGFEVGGQGAVSRAAWDHFAGAVVVLQAVSTDYVAELRAAGKFVVAIGPRLRGADAVIKLDNAGGVRDALTHLAGHGHTRIGFVAPTWQADAAERHAAYRATMSRLGLAEQPLIGGDLPAELSMDDQGYRAAREFLDGDRHCTAVMVGTDRIALGFVRGLQEAGVGVPADVAVVGIDDVDEAAVSDPPLATVAISFERVGAMAFTVALKGGAGEDVEVEHVVPQRYVPRESCGCASGSGGTGREGAGSPVEAFTEALLEAAQEGAVEASVDPVAVRATARDVAAFLDPPAAGGSGDVPPAVEAIARRVNVLCPLDRSVQAALRAVRVLADALADPLREREPARVWAMATSTLDLCDAIRSGQLQRRMAEYVNLKRMQVSHYFVGNNLLGGDRDELRSLGWLEQTEAEAGALGLWSPPGVKDRVTLRGVYERAATDRSDRSDRSDRPDRALPGSPAAVESFPPSWMLRAPDARGRLVVLTQVGFEESEWGVLAVAGGQVLQSSLVQETFQQWSILMSASLDQEQANSDLARQAGELTAAYETEMALLEEVRISEERYALAAEAAHDALWDWDVPSGRVYYSSNWKALLGHRENEIGAAPAEWLDRIHPEDTAAVQEQLGQVLSGVEQFIDFEHRLRVSTGDYRWMACSGRSVSDDEGRPVRLVGSITDVTVRRLLQDQLVHEALFDGLTGLAKSSLFKDRLNQAIELAKRREDYSFALLYVDLDGFKAVNDRLGHAAGDELLASVAGRLTESLRTNDSAARLGGDEFAILLTEIELSELPLVIARIQAMIGEPHVVGGQSATVGAAIGVAVSSAGYSTAEEMLHEADTAMYRAKHRAHGTRTEGTTATGRLRV